MYYHIVFRSNMYRGFLSSPQCDLLCYFRSPKCPNILLTITVDVTPIVSSLNNKWSQWRVSLQERGSLLHCDNDLASQTPSQAPAAKLHGSTCCPPSHQRARG